MEFRAEIGLKRQFAFENCYPRFHFCQNINTNFSNSDLTQLRIYESDIKKLEAREEELQKKADDDKRKHKADLKHG